MVVHAIIKKTELDKHCHHKYDDGGSISCRWRYLSPMLARCSLLMRNNLSFICDKYWHLTLCLLMNEPNCFHFECLKVQSRDSNLRPRVNFHDFTLELEVPGPHRLNRFQPDPAAFEDLLVFAPVKNRARKPRAPEEPRVRKLIMKIQIFASSSISLYSLAAL